MIYHRSPITTRSVSRNRKVNNHTNRVKMANQQTVHHEVYTKTIDIPKFSGESDSIKLEDYIARVQTYITNKGIKNDDQKIEAFKASIDSEKGKARVLVNCRPFANDIKEYDKYIQEFKKHFTQLGECEPLRSLVRYLNMEQENKESQMDYIGRLDNYARQMERTFKKSKWSAPGHPDKISYEQVFKILMMAKIISKCKGSLPEKLYKDLNPDVDLCQIDYMISEYLEKDPQSQQFVMPARTLSPSPVRGDRQSRTRTPASARFTRPRSTSRSRYSNQCYTCGRVGHTSRNCESQIICGNCQYQGHHESRCYNQPWCMHHQMMGHRTRDCRRGPRVNFRPGPTVKDGGQTPPVPQ